MSENKKVKIYIGFDQRESIAYHTFVQSLIDNASIPLEITPLAVRNLKGYEEKHDDKSNDFVYSRFLTHFLIDYKAGLFLLMEIWFVRQIFKIYLI